MRHEISLDWEATLEKFPYAVLYTVKPERVLVLAVMHFSRHPEY